MRKEPPSDEQVDIDNALRIAAAHRRGHSEGYDAGIEAARRCLAETGTIYGLTEADLREKYEREQPTAPS